MDSLQYSPPGILMPHGVLDENVVKTLCICMIFVKMFELDSNLKHQEKNNSLSERAHSLLQSVVSLRS